MKSRRATALVAVVALLAAPVARADEAPAREKYDRSFVAFDDFGGIDPKTGALYRISEPYQGKYKVTLAPAAFYRAVGREDLAIETESRERARTLLMVAGGATVLGALAGAVIVAPHGPASPCDVASPGFRQCAADSQARFESSVRTAGVILGIGLLTGGVLYLGGLSINPNPIGVPAMRELADRHNQALKESLGLSMTGGPGSGGLALTGKF